MTNLSVITAGSLATAIVERRHLAKALEAASRVVEQRNTLPIFGMVHLFASAPNRLTVRATDEDIEIDIDVACEAIDARFNITAPCKKLNDLAKKAATSATLVTLCATLPNMTREQAEQMERPDASATLTATFGKAEYTIAGMQAWAFPTLDMAGERIAFAMSGTALWAALDRCRGAMSSEETRYYLNGIFMHRVGDEVAFVATDGHRMHVQNFDVPDGMGDFAAGTIIPRKLVDTVHGLTKGKACPSSFQVEASAARLVFSFGDVTIRGKAIDGTFPDYSRVVPRQNEHRITFDSDALAEAVNAVKLIRDDRGGVIRLAFDKGQAMVSTKSGDGHAARSPVDSDAPSGFCFEIGINARYLLESIATACPASDKARFEFSDPGSAILLRGDSPRFKICLMPTRV